MRLLQVTIGADATQFTTLKIYSPFIVIQNNSIDDMRIGDNTVSSDKGVAISPGGGSLTVQRADNRIPLFEYWVAGTEGDTIDILYEQG